MRCHICNKVLTDKEVQYNHDHQDFDPCVPCLLVIEDVLDKYRDRPSMDEDEFPDDDLEDLYFSLDNLPDL